jgi:hypothetical protein
MDEKRKALLRELHDALDDPIPPERLCSERFEQALLRLFLSCEPLHKDENSMITDGGNG